jgi:hypothetical protein
MLVGRAYVHGIIRFKLDDETLVAFEESFSENLQPASFQQRQRGAQQITLLFDAPNALWLTGVVRAAGFSGRAARGSVVPRKMACHPADSRSKGQPSRCPFVDGSRLATLQKERSAEQPDAEA